MNSIIIKSVIVCGPDNTVLPGSPAIKNAQLVSVSAAPGWTTSQLYLKVTCKLIPGGAGMVRYQLSLDNLVDWEFKNDVKHRIDFEPLQTANAQAVYLPFKLKKRKAITSAVVLVLEAMDAGIPPPNCPSRSLTLGET